MKKVIILLFIFIGICHVSYASSGNKDTTKFKELLHMIEITQPQPEQRIKHVDQLIAEAKRQNNNKYLCQGYLYHMFIAYNAYNTQEVNKWMILLEPLARQEKLYDILFQGKQCCIDLMLMNEEFEKGEEEVNKLLKEATKLNNKWGILIAHLCMSHVYSQSYRSNLAAHELEKAYSISLTMNNPGIKSEITRDLAETYKITKDYRNQLKYLKIQETDILDYIDKHPEYESSYKDNLMMIYALLTEYYIKDNNPIKAKYYMEMGHKYFSQEYSEMYKTPYHLTCALYYEYTHDYPKALVSINESINIIKDVFSSDYYLILASKIRILLKMGNAKECAITYRKALDFNDSLQVIILQKQISHLQNTQEADSILLEKNRLQNYISLSILIYLTITLLILVCYGIYAIKIRNKLIRTEQEMRIMAEKMEIANIAKDRFLNNISIYINIPLNTIVKGSLRLSSDDNIPNEVREELCRSINTTTEELMLIINNILDLSRLEAKMMKFTPQKIDLALFINDMIRATYPQSNSIIKNIPNTNDLLLDIDTIKFSGIFRSILEHHSPQINISVSLEIIENNLFQIDILGSELAYNQFSQKVIIQNEVNQLFIKHFRGTYQIPNIPEDPIRITFPISS